MTLYLDQLEAIINKNNPLWSGIGALTAKQRHKAFTRRTIRLVRLSWSILYNVLVGGYYKYRGLSNNVLPL